MATHAQRPSRAAARPSDEFVPEGAAVVAPPRVAFVWYTAGAFVLPLVLVLAPISDSVRRIAYLVALGVVWAFIFRAARKRSMRRWTGIAAGTGLVVLSEIARTAFVTTGRDVFIH